MNERPSPASTDSATGRDPPVLGVVGTAKNTGKTTTLNQVAAHLSASGKTFAVTSIGFDGEDFDTVTGLGKPGIVVPEGSVVATAQPLFHSSGARFEDARDTGVRCALGRVFVARVRRCGNVVLAGPQTARGLEEVIRALRRTCDPDVILVDGSFSRMAPMAVATHLLIATGAARSDDVSVLCAEMNGIGTVMSLPLSGVAEGPELDIGTSLMSRSSVPSGVSIVLGKARRGFLVVRAAGPASPQAVEEFASALSERSSLRVRLVFDHPVNLLVSGRASCWPAVVEGLIRGGHEMAVRRSVRLLGFTLNPSKPVYFPSLRRYEQVTLDAPALLREVKNRSAFPVTDPVLEEPSRLEMWVEGLLCPFRGRGT